MVAAAGAELSVEGGTIEHGDDGVIDIRRAPSASTLEVRCAAGTDLTISTVSGEIDSSVRSGRSASPP